MGVLTAETFADWLHPTDVIELYHQGGEPDAKAYVTALLSDGLLQAAAGQLIVNGRDRGLALIPPELWPEMARSDVWLTGRFRFVGTNEAGEPVGVSAYDVRVDPNRRSLPARPAASPTAPPKPVRGGRPAAPWWDDLWIEICRQVFAGELIPDRQGDIEKAMHAWLAANGHEAGETTIRDRARRLFQALNG